mmetsp:Transcript_35856/g.103124  ORF Transcript_35856/g.103124 Transcript_35856/m.103124 type:complete len:221 (-) Transcript_35856:324-986(-)
MNTHTYTTRRRQKDIRSAGHSKSLWVLRGCTGIGEQVVRAATGHCGQPALVHLFTHGMRNVHLEITHEHVAQNLLSAQHRRPPVQLVQRGVGTRPTQNRPEVAPPQRRGRLPTDTDLPSHWQCRAIAAVNLWRHFSQEVSLADDDLGNVLAAGARLEFFLLLVFDALEGDEGVNNGGDEDVENEDDADDVEGDRVEAAELPGSDQLQAVLQHVPVVDDEH